MTRLIVVDCETTGLDVGRHEPWDIAMQAITPEAGTVGEMKEWHPRLSYLHQADAIALQKNRFYERTSETEFKGGKTRNKWVWHTASQVAGEIAEFTDNALLVGTNTKFDIGFIENFLRRNGFAPAWDYHDLDVSNLIIGFAIGTGGVDGMGPKLPTGWRSTQLSEIVGVDADAFDRHTARGDVEWVIAQLQNMLMLGDKNV